MAKQILTVKNFNGGFSDSEKEGIKGAFLNGQSLDLHTEPTSVTVLPQSVDISGGQVTGNIKWIVSGKPYDTNVYFIDEDGQLYRLTNADVFSVVTQIANCVGQGLELHSDYLYYTQNTQLGRYGTLSSGVPTFDDDFQVSLNPTNASGFAPLKAFKEGLAVGNGNDLGWWDGAVWDQDRIILPPGFNIRCLEVLDEFLVIGAWRGDSITDSEEGYAFFWDGSSTTFNFFVNIPEGGINALLNSRNRLLSIVGSSGIVYLGHSPFTKMQQLPRMTPKKYIEVYPGAVTNWKGMALIGFSADTDNADILQGVWQWGARSDKYIEVLNFAYPISTGTVTGTGVQITAIKGIGDRLYIARNDNADHGVDRVLQTNAPYATAFWESLIFDDNRPGDEKQAQILKVTHKPLQAGESIQLGFQPNRSGSFTFDIANTVVGTTETRYPIDSAISRFYECQLRVNIVTAPTSAPTLTSVALYYDDGKTEEVF